MPLISGLQLTWRRILSLSGFPTPGSRTARPGSEAFGSCSPSEAAEFEARCRRIFEEVFLQ